MAERSCKGEVYDNCMLVRDLNVTLAYKITTSEKRRKARGHSPPNVPISPSAVLLICILRQSSFIANVFISFLQGAEHRLSNMLDTAYYDPTEMVWAVRDGEEPVQFVEFVHARATDIRTSGFTPSAR